MTLMGRVASLACVLIAVVATSGSAETTCYGEGSYRVCTTVTQRADGSMSVRSSDSMGNSYSMDTEIHTSPSGDVTVRSKDSMGNRYKLESWTDSVGSHSKDSFGNRCTITNDGRTIGCD